MMIRFITAIIATMILSSTYANTCPHDFQNLPFYQARIEDLSGVDCDYGKYPYLKTITFGYKDMGELYEPTFGPWHIFVPRHHTCIAPSDSDVCGFKLSHL